MTALLLVAEMTFAGILTASINWISLVSFRRANSAHWTERARRLYPARTAAAANCYVIALWICLLQGRLFSSPPTPYIAGPIAWLGGVIGSFPFQREIYPKMSLKHWLHHSLAFWFIRLPFFGLLFGIGYLMPYELDWPMPLLFLASLIVGQIWSHNGLVWMLKLARLTLPADYRLQSIVRNASGKMNMSTPCVLILKSCTANAFALVRSRMLLFTSSLLEQMGDEEIAAICFHELGHLKESRTEIVMRGIGTKALYPWIFLKPLQHWLNDWIGALVILFATTVIIITFSRYISRKLEVKADSTAKQNEAEGGVYARALERIYQINLMPAVMPKSTTHPSLYDRLIAAGAQPDYARPERPASTSRIYLLCMIGFGLTLGWYLASRS